MGLYLPEGHLEAAEGHLELGQDLVEVLDDLLLGDGPGQTLGAIERVLEDDRLHARAIAWVLKKEAI